MSEKSTSVVGPKMDLEEAKRWVRAKGSRRLLLALEQGLLEACLTVYMEERLADELPGWRRFTGPLRYDKPRNPSEAELVALKVARRQRPDAQLVYDREKRQCFVIVPFLGRVAYYPTEGR